MKKKYDTALVVGAGSFGTCIACVLAKNFSKILLKTERSNNNKKLPSNIEIVSQWDKPNRWEKNIQLVVSGLPSTAIEEYFTKHKQRFSGYLKKGIPLVSLSKGIDPETLELPDDLLFSLFAKYKKSITFLSGPSFAGEIMEEQITLVSLAGSCHKTLKLISDMFETSYFKTFACLDIKGVLLGGAIKNVLAIAGGIIEGLGFNHNTRAALITLGIGEMLHFGKIFNARAETFYGLSGMGDLILSTTGGISRNKQFGLKIAQGRDPLDILQEDGILVEGHKTCEALYRLAKKHNIQAAITDSLHEVLYQGKDPQRIIQKLMRYPVVFEEDIFSPKSE